jgi:hypothetical protein
MTNDRHLSTDDVAAYLDAAIGDAERERVEEHAASCGECRREIAELTAASRPGREKASWHVWVPAAAAAAIIAVLLVQTFGTLSVPAGSSRLRGPRTTPGAEGAIAIRVIAPPPEGVPASGDIDFVWQAGGEGASYRLTLMDDEGGVIWTLATTDTVAVLPDTIPLDPASRYHWYVDAMLDDGRTASSGVHSFITRR